MYLIEKQDFRIMSNELDRQLYNKIGKHIKLKERDQILSTTLFDCKSDVVFQRLSRKNYIPFVLGFNSHNCISLHDRFSQSFAHLNLSDEDITSISSNIIAPVFTNIDLIFSCLNFRNEIGLEFGLSASLTNMDHCYVLRLRFPNRIGEPVYTPYYLQNDLYDFQVYDYKTVQIILSAFAQCFPKAIGFNNEIIDLVNIDDKETVFYMFIISKLDLFKSKVMDLLHSTIMKHSSFKNRSNIASLNADENWATTLLKHGIEPRVDLAASFHDDFSRSLGSLITILFFEDLHVFKKDVIDEYCQIATTEFLDSLSIEDLDTSYDQTLNDALDFANMKNTKNLNRLLRLMNLGHLQL